MAAYRRFGTDETREAKTPGTQEIHELCSIVDSRLAATLQSITLCGHTLHIL